MIEWDSMSFEQVVSAVAADPHPHVLFLVGSAASLGEPSSCLSIHEIREQLVLEPLRALAEGRAEIRRIIGRLLSSRETAPDGVRDLVAQLPFEQFMGCLHAVSPAAGFDVITAGCGEGFGRLANANHEATAVLARWLLDATPTRQVTVLTTNYDMWLDAALRRCFGGELPPSAHSGIPRFELQRNGKVLRYAKLHGTMDTPGSLVFTFEQMAHLVVDEDVLASLEPWILGPGQIPPSLALSVGYGFWDPDLRPMLAALLTKGPARLIRNVLHPAEHGQKPVRSAPPRAPTGPEALQTEFFSSLEQAGVTLAEYESTLVGLAADPEHPSILTGLCQRLADPGAELAPPTPTKTLSPFVSAATESLRAHLGDRDVVFLGRLLDACCVPDGSAMFREALLRARGADRTDLTRSFLYSLSNEHRMEEAATECQKLRHDVDDPGVRATSLAFESFARTIGRDRSAVRAARCLRQARRLLGGCAPDVEAFVEHYDTHFRTKALETAVLGSADWGFVTGLHRFASRRARRVAAQIRDVADTARQAKDLRLLGDAQTLLAECLILAGEPIDAMTAAQRSRRYRLFMGRSNNAALADRMMGWAFLASTAPAARGNAIQSFARGLWRAVACDDVSIRGKLAANLVRAILAERVREIDFGTPVASAPPGLLDSCKALADAADTDLEAGAGLLAAGHRLREPVECVIAYLLYLYGDRSERLRDEMLRYSNLRRYPIYLPMDPVRF